MLFAWLRARPQPGGRRPETARGAAVREPGRPEDEYFADGVTDEVRGKLAALPGLEVIARTSSVQYKQTTKSPQQIGRELGVEYLLTGTVRWEKEAAEPGRVRVSPELVQVCDAPRPGGRSRSTRRSPTCSRCRPTSRPGWPRRWTWRSARASRSDSRERPTENLAAYDAYLKGEEATGGLAIDLAAYRRAIDYYERAVALDSTFALAWARLSRAHSLLYAATPTAVGAAAAGQAAKRALALAPKLPEGYYALAYYHYVVQQDLTGAYEQSRRAWQLAPKDARFLALVALNEGALGHAEEGLEHLREAQVLDPRSVETATTTVWALVGLRRYPEALEAARRGSRSPQPISG